MEIEDNRIYVNHELAIKTKEYIIDCYENNNLTDNITDDMNLFNLGQYYYNIQKNYPQAVEYYTISAEKGNIKAMNKLVYYYCYIEKNYTKSNEYYVMAMEKENSIAKNKQNNYPKDIQYYMMAVEAVEKGDSSAMNYLGDYYYYNNEKNTEKAIEYYMMAVEKGNSKSMFKLGCHYHNEKNYPETVKYYMMAIEKGNSFAMNNLGVYYKDIEKNYPKAFEYYTMAIEKGNSNAIFNLGYYYHYIKENYPKAIEYYIMAIKKKINNALKHIIKITTPLKRYKLFTDNNIDLPESYDNELEIYKNKIKNTSKLDDCPVCLESKNCVLLNCFAHYICTDCYIELHNKPCPLCRL
jgi:TPR repeat protein